MKKKTTTRKTDPNREYPLLVAVYANAEQLSTLRKAAEYNGSSLSGYVRASALHAAEALLAKAPVAK